MSNVKCSPKEQSLSAPVMSYHKNHNFDIETIEKWLEIEFIKSDNVNQQV